jgi:hypothetical protein
MWSVHTEVSARRSDVKLATAEQCSTQGLKYVGPPAGSACLSRLFENVSALRATHCDALGCRCSSAVVIAGRGRLPVTVTDGKFHKLGDPRLYPGFRSTLHLGGSGGREKIIYIHIYILFLRLL